jgi:hypothetical protein
MALNGISTLLTKEARQLAKLNLSAANRSDQADQRPFYDITLLPTRYVGNSVIDNPHPNGLIQGRPWSAASPTFYVDEDGDFLILDAAGNKLLL